MDSMVIYGSPGCGKTTRMLQLLGEEQKKHGESQVCFVSFTRAGAKEATQRTGSDGAHIRTLHSLMYKLNGANQSMMVNRSTLRAFAKRTGFKFAATEANDQNEGMEVGDQYMALYSYAQATMQPHQDVYRDSYRPGEWADFDFFCRAYDAWKKNSCFMDFGDLLSGYIANPVPHGYKVIFIDEAQDLSPQQWCVIECMINADGVEKVYVAGDDDQAIFEWSGANPHGMDEFRVKYGAELVVLEKSHRIPLSVHMVAHSILQRIGRRQQKVYDAREEVGYVSTVNNFLNTKINDNETTMILCRCNSNRREVEKALIEMRVAYRTPSGAPSPIDSKVGKAVRVFQKYSQTDRIEEVIDPREIDDIYAVAYESVKKQLNDGKISEVIGRGWRRTLDIRSPELVDYFVDVDLVNTVPLVTIGTIHSAKGSEADHVVLFSSITTKIEREMFTAPDAEHRVWYVAVTRARKRLTIVEDSMDDSSTAFYPIPLNKEY